MKKLDLLDKLAIAALLFFTFMFFATAQEQRIGLGSDNENIYGTWQAWDGTVLYMNYNEDGDTFLRQSDNENGKEVATGSFTLEEKHIYVQKENDEYRLMFYLKGMQLIVTKPDSAGGPGQAWLFQKISDYGLSY
jgi:hypothetical protein|tara:strand:- start:759 stop:1163 length:405 start_codon:yes stop_codon:yes gene_type:complete